MLKRVGGYLKPRRGDVPDASRQLQDQGYAVLPGVLKADEIAALRDEIEGVYQSTPPDGRAASYRDPEVDEDFRYEMYNRSPLAQKVIGHPAILEVIDPLLGDDCHVIANTCWRNPPRKEDGHGGGFWHIDSGPHIARSADQVWPDHIPYPIFAIGCHIYLQDCPLECGPTGVIPGSHKSGRTPPSDRLDDVTLTWNDTPVLPLLAEAGDVAMFVSDVWHRRLPTLEGDTGRFFLQAHYGRRDIAQRVLPTAEVNHVSKAAADRIESDRERHLLGLHPNLFYDG